MSTLQQRDPDVSVIVPVYNLERFILPLLVSLKEQRLGRFTAEYIFVLNNCTDKSEQIIRSSGLPCKILTCTEQGCGPARNVGLREARGEYIWFMDGDDWLLNRKALQIADRAYVLETGNLTLSGTGAELASSDAVKKAYLGG